MGFKLRKYQIKAEQEIKEFLKNKNSTKGLVVHPVGTGKSLLTGMFSKYADGPTLVLQPNKELLEQNYEKAIMYGLKPTVFSASLGEKEVSNLIYATPGSVVNRVKEFKHVQNIVIDEAHLGTTRKFKNGRIIGYSDIERIIQHIKPKKILGLTATPLMLVNTLSGSKIQIINRTRRNMFYKSPIISIVQINEVIKDYWAPLSYEINKDYDTSKLRLNSTGNDFTDKSILESFEVNNGVNKVLSKVDEAISNLNRKSILIFAPSVEIAKELETKDSRIVGVYGETKQDRRNQIIKDFKDGKIKAVVNFGVLTAGFDFPDLDTIIMARDTNSYQLYYQMIGRVVRPFINNENESAMIIDLSSNTKRFGSIDDITFENDDSIGGWALCKLNRVLTGFPLTTVDKYPTKEEVRVVIKSKKSKYTLTADNITLLFGKYKGKLVKEVFDKDKGYLSWMISSNFEFKGDYGKALKREIKQLLINDGLKDD